MAPLLPLLPARVRPIQCRTRVGRVGLWARFTLLALLTLAACNLEGRGDAPVRGEIYFPTALQLSKDGEQLFVVNSNFDRRYRGGSVQAYNLSKLAIQLQQDCLDQEPGVECELPPAPLLDSEVLIGSLARAVAISGDGERLLVPTHANRSLTFVRTGAGEGGKLNCGGRRTCSDAYRTGAGENARGQTMPSDPVAVVSVPISDLPGGDEATDGEGRDATLVVHRLGQVSLFVDGKSGGDFVPALVDVIGGFAGNLTGIAYDADSGLFHITTDLSSFGNKFLMRVGVAGLESDTPYLFSASATTLHGLTSRESTWGARFLTAPRSVDVDALVLAQNPDALLSVSMAPDGLSADIKRIVELGARASRMTAVDIELGAKRRSLAVVSCFGQRRVYVIDVDSGAVLSIIPGFSGPTELVVDAKRGLLFVADFRSSTIRIVDLRPLAEGDAASIVGTLGHPQFLEELN